MVKGKTVCMVCHDGGHRRCKAQLRFGQENGKIPNFSDDKFHAKNDVKENWSLTKNIDLTLNAIALILIKYIRVNVLYRASNCYLARTSSTLY